MSNFNLPEINIAGGPTIEFAFHGDVCTAELAGARLRAERLDDEHADLRLHDATGKVLASVVVAKLWDDESITVSVMNIGSALLWSHARWVAAQAGGAAEVTIVRPARFEKAITFCGQPARVACDGLCHKAWGLSQRPRIRLSETNPDDYAWLADDELFDARVEPGTSEGGQHKPRDARGAEDMNKWCVRECERCVMTEAGAPHAPIQLRDFSRRKYNIPSSDPARAAESVVIARRITGDAVLKQVVAARREPCPGRKGWQHASALTLADGSEISADDALALIDAGAVFYMLPPPGAPAHAAHVATGLPLLLQTRMCPDCGKRVLFA